MITKHCTERLRPFLLLINIAGAVTALGQPTASIAPSPSQSLSVGVVAEADPVFAPLFWSGRANLRPPSILVSNKGNQPIIGIVMVTTTVDAGGVRHTSRDVIDSFMSGGAPVLNPGATMLGVPTGVWIRPQEVSGLIANDSGIRRLQHASEWVRATLLSSQAIVSIDAVVLASGQVDGPDSTGYAIELNQRRQAAQSVLDAITGPSPDFALRQLAGKQVAKGDWLSQWQRRWAGDYLAASASGFTAPVINAIKANLRIPLLFKVPASQ